MSIKIPQVFTGGTKAGRRYCTWPFARFVIDQNNLSIVSGVGNFDFTMNDDFEVVIYKHLILRIPVGIQFKHKKSDYPERVVFWYLKANSLLNLIEQTPFKKFVKR